LTIKKGAALAPPANLINCKPSATALPTCAFRAPIGQGFLPSFDLTRYSRAIAQASCLAKAAIQRIAAFPQAGNLLTGHK